MTLFWLLYLYSTLRVKPELNESEFIDFLLTSSVKIKLTILFSIVGCLKITKDKASDANHADVEVTSSLRRRPHAKREGRISTQMRTSRSLLNAEVAFQSQT